ncbi:MAG: RidA family protein [Candidatus Marinimicrobia bacterium]|nr:RidA family protein [Candidatus Neomarinimicrobiota bacterium]MCF7828085.1 RidA family protein [Candidatus Neomarinimicrobiota bacterium]MCF7879740.1 RidA family protein [Candidatus Neomarinimicrobiota bacterium]
MGKKVIETANAPKPVGTYSQGIVANGFLFSAGQIGIDPKTGELVTDSFAAEVRQVFHNLQAVLSGGGLTLDNVVKFKVFMTDLSQFGTVNEVFAEYYPTEPPARSAVEVSALPKNANIEIECIAVCE